MASFTNRGTKKKPSWQYTVSNKGNPIRKGGFRTKKEAEAAARIVEEQLQKGIHPNLKKVYFTDYFETWLELFKTNIGDNTEARYLDTLDTLKEYFEGVYIQEVTRQSYQAFINEYAQGKDRKCRERTKSTVQKLNSHVRACVSEAMDEGLIGVDFTRKITLPGKEGKTSQEKVLNYKEGKELLSYLMNKEKKAQTDYLIILGLMSGMRFGEMVGLTRKDFDFFNSTITINKTWGYTNKMHKGFGTTKNYQSTRIIHMDRKTMKLFEKWFEETPDNILRLIFYSPKSKYKVVSNGAANKQLKSVLEQLEIDSISVHGLRHTHASILLYEGASIYYVSERLGHDTIETTMKEYTHVLRELRQRDSKKTMDILGKLYV